MAWEKYVLPQMNDGGITIMSSSVAGLNGSPNISTYFNSKHAAVGIMPVTIVEVAPRKIRVNTTQVIDGGLGVQ